MIYSMTALSLLLTAAALAALLIGSAFAWTVRARLQKETSSLRKDLNRLQGDLEKEQGKADRLAGFLGRLQQFGISATGEAPGRAFAEALIDSVSALLKTELVVLLKADRETQELLPVAARGISPEVLSRLRIRPGEGLLGKAAQGLKIVLQNNASNASGTDFLTAPYLLTPILSQARGVGLLVMAKPEGGSFGPEARELAQLFAGQAALTLEDHAFFEDREKLSEQLILSLLGALEAKDSYTHRHSSRTRNLVRAISQEIPLPESLIREIEAGAFLHDVGKIGISETILQKTGPLTPQEYDVMKHHPSIGHRILQPIASLRSVAAIVLYHQEWYNGSGYPEGLAGEEIPLGARIVQILDAWDAMTSDRSYRKAMPKAAAIAELRRQEGTQFDPKLVALFLRVIDRLEREGTPTTEERPTATIDNGK
jgi:HD-GYP domain-containing protein (c-di-GMP phosphodiesterase class II)